MLLLCLDKNSLITIITHKLQCSHSMLRVNTESETALGSELIPVGDISERYKRFQGTSCNFGV